MPKSYSPSAGIRTHGGDQAAGLRRLLRPAAVRVLPVAGGRDGFERAAIVANLARACAASGYTVVVLDQSVGDVARTFGLSPRYELRHLLDGDRPYAEVALRAADRLRVLPGRRGMAVLAARQGGASALFAAFGELAQPADLIIVNIEEAETAGALLGGMDGEVLLVTSAASDSITATYAQVKRLAASGDLARYRLVVVDCVGENEGRAVADNFAGTTRRFLGVRLIYGGCVPREATAVPASSTRRRAVRARTAPSEATSPPGAFDRLAAGLADWSCFEVDGRAPHRLPLATPHLGSMGPSIARASM